MSNTSTPRVMDAVDPIQAYGGSPEETLVIMNTEDIVARAFGIKGLECRHGYSKVEMPLDGRQLNRYGCSHGGATFTLIDIAMGLCARGSGFYSMTMNASVSYMRPGLNGPLVAEAFLLNETGRTAGIEIEVRDAEGDLVAKCLSTVHKRAKMPSAGAAPELAQGLSRSSS